LKLAFLLALGGLAACGGTGGGEDGGVDLVHDTMQEDPAVTDDPALEGDIPSEEGDAPEGDVAGDVAEEEAPPPRVAIYDDTASSDPAAWPEGLDMLEDVLVGAGFLCERLTRNGLNDPTENLMRFSAVVFGGGYAYPGYTLEITEGAKERLRGFVEGGGVFMGVCAGAFFACDAVRWDGTTYDDESGYTLDLFDGTCAGPIEELAVYPDWALAEIGFSAHPALEGYAPAPFERTMWYAAGPWFEPAVASAGVVATYQSEGIPELGRPALITAAHGEGCIILWGPHPEVRWDGVSPDAYLLAGTLLHWAVDM
jgi:glutamine amidotransferase-like uncharacterized protein